MSLTPIVYVVDDDQHMRGLLCRLLKSAGIPSHAVATFEEFLGIGVPNRLGCIVLDVSMSGMPGPDLQFELIKRRIRLPIVMISGHAEIRDAVRAIKQGAADVLEKPFSDHVFLECVRQALQTSQQLVNLDAQRQLLEQRLALLTPREREVLNLLVEGLTRKQIAGRLNISSKTADIHRGRVLQKTNAESVIQLANLVHRTSPLK